MPKSRDSRLWFLASMLTILSYVLLGWVAFTNDAVLLVVLIPSGLGCLGLGIILWAGAVIKDIRNKGVL
jgi:hypothetical protein